MTAVRKTWRRWTAEDDAALRRMRVEERKSYREIAAALDRTPNAVGIRTTMLGCRVRRRYAWSEESDRWIMAKSLPDAELAKVGCPVKDLRSRPRSPARAAEARTEPRRKGDDRTEG